MTPDIETRLQLATERFQQLEAEISAYLAKASNSTTFDLVPETMMVSFSTRPIEPPPPRLAALIGEVLYHLRSALDFAVFVSAFLDTGEEKSDTQFPIVTVESEWDTQAKRRIKYLSPERQHVICLLQPFSGQKWTERLQQLSNPDKHRRLNAVALDAEHTLTIKRTDEGFETDFTPKVVLTFDDGYDVLSSLKELLEKVREAVEEVLNPRS